MLARFILKKTLGLGMEKEIKKILEIVTKEQELNTSRNSELNNSFSDLKNFFLKEQELNASRYSELRSEIKTSHLKLNESIQKLEIKVDRVFETLSQDIGAVAEDVEKLENRVSKVEKNINF